MDWNPNQLKYVQLLENRIKNQRMELKWWNNNFMKKKLVSKNSNKWKASDVLSLFKRLNLPYRISEYGVISKKRQIRRKIGEHE